MLDIFLMRLIDDGMSAKLALAFASLFGKNMALACFFAFNFTGSGNFKAFAGTTVRFHLWHNETPVEDFLKLKGLKDKHLSL